MKELCCWSICKDVEEIEFNADRTELDNFVYEEAEQHELNEYVPILDGLASGGYGTYGQLAAAIEEQYPDQF